jgi:hypothetical protein
MQFHPGCIYGTLAAQRLDFDLHLRGGLLIISNPLCLGLRLGARLDLRWVTDEIRPSSET